MLKCPACGEKIMSQLQATVHALRKDGTRLCETSRIIQRAESSGRL